MGKKRDKPHAAGGKRKRNVLILLPSFAAIRNGLEFG